MMAGLNKRRGLHQGATMALICAALMMGLLPGKAVEQARAAGEIRFGFYVTYNPNSLASLRANVDHLNYVSPWFYTVDRNGRVNGTAQPEVNALLRAKEIKNLPMVKNSATYNDFHEVLYNPARRDWVITQLRALVQSNAYDGVTIDFEAVNAADEQGMTDFMAALYPAFKADGKLVAMAVPAKGRDVNSGWAGAYNYRALRNWSDYFVIMAYDKHYPGGDPGAVAPYPWLNELAGYTVETLGAGKVIWGIGLYGYDWNTSATPRRNAEPRTWAEAHDLARQYNGTLRYDETERATQLIYVKDNQRHEVWFEDRRSFDAKIEYVARQGYAGFAIWRLGQEDPGVWDSIGSLRGLPAPDPVPPAPAPSVECAPIAAFASTPTRVYFPQTGHSLGGGFLTYWLAHGGLPIFGYPLTEEFQEVSPTNGQTYTVQYFERNRFEWHPENQPPNDVLLGLLGVQFVSQRFFPMLAPFQSDPGRVYFPETQHALQGGFLDTWRSKGGLEQFGFPITDDFQELSLTDGQTYTVQYFERARFEYHPEHAGTDHAVQLGLLGAWSLKQRGCGS